MTFRPDLPTAAKTSERDERSAPGKMYLRINGLIGAGGSVPAAVLQELFGGHGWGGSWRDGVYDYACIIIRGSMKSSGLRGEAEVDTALGQEKRPELVAHMRLSALDVSFQEAVHSVSFVNTEVAKRRRFAGNRMDAHKNAPLTPRGRDMMVRAVVDSGPSKAAAVRRSTRRRRPSANGSNDSRPRARRPARSLIGAAFISGPSDAGGLRGGKALRRPRQTRKEIATEVGVLAATVSRILKRLGFDRLSTLEPAEPVRRYEWASDVR